MWRNPSRARTSVLAIVTQTALALAITAIAIVVAINAGNHSVDERTDADVVALADHLAATAVVPQLDGPPVHGLTTETASALSRAFTSASANGADLRLYTLDGTLLLAVPEEPGSQPIVTRAEEKAALGASSGEPVLLDLEPGRESRTLQAFVPLDAGNPPVRIGVLSMKLSGVGNATWRTALRQPSGLGLLAIGVLLVLLVAIGGIRARRQARYQVHVAGHDLLTGLPNRASFSKRVASTQAKAGTTVAVALIDINRFAAVNESLGHDTGDQMLVDMGRRLRDFLDPRDLVAHLGGDVFGLLFVSCADAADVATTLGKLRSAVETPLVLAGLPVQVEVLIGYDVSNDSSVAGDRLLRQAQAALTSAKSGRGALVRYEPHQGPYDAEQLALVGELRRAISMGELRLHYQPKIQAGSSELEGFEALLRWQHPRYGLLPPAEFLPLAEYTSLMGMLTDWVLDTALAQLIDWGDDMKHLTMSVNVSARNLPEPSFVQRVGSVLRRYRIPPSRLVLEVTETAMFVDPQHVRATLADLDHAGVRISLDDFGQGQTSLRFLSGLPLSEVKIDRVFVRDMVSLPSHTAIVRSVVDLAHRLGLTVVAEGVEDAAALAALEAMGCDSIQGFLIARPMPPDQVPSWVSDRIESATARSLWTPSRPESHTTSTARAASIG